MCKEKLTQTYIRSITLQSGRTSYPIPSIKSLEDKNILGIVTRSGGKDMHGAEIVPSAALAEAHLVVSEDNFLTHEGLPVQYLANNSFAENGTYAQLPISKLSESGTRVIIDAAMAANHSGKVIELLFVVERNNNC